MRCAVIIEDSDGRQMLGLTSDEAMRLGADGVYTARFGEYTLKFLVDAHAEPQTARVGALPWPDISGLD